MAAFIAADVPLIDPNLIGKLFLGPVVLLPELLYAGANLHREFIIFGFMSSINPVKGLLLWKRSFKMIFAKTIKII